MEQPPELEPEDAPQRIRQLRRDLLQAQADLRSAGFSFLVILGGVDGGGKGEMANLLNAWMDPRHIVTRAFLRPSDEEAERPEFWRFWMSLPTHGQLGVFLRAWYSKPLLQRAYERTTSAEFDRQLDRIVAFEKMLTSANTRILKFWMHLSQQDQAERLRALEADPSESWRVSELDWKHWRMYDSFVDASERLITHTDRPSAPWKLVDGRHAPGRSLTVGEALLEHLRSALETGAGSREAAAPRTKRVDVQTASVQPSGEVPLRPLDRIDLTRTISQEAYESALPALQGRLNRLARLASDTGQSSILVFEGWDAAGKGGAIRRMVSAMDARWYQVIPIGAPTDEEGRHHYLWRFWRHLPRAGRVTVFDRSWYGRVLVERVEGFASEVEWRRAFSEINDFERRLTDHGMMVVKFWMHIGDDEQARRFAARREVPHKQWKLTQEDWRNRQKRPDYEAAANDMLERTNQPNAPWVTVSANDKAYARLRILTEVCRHLERTLDVPADYLLPELPSVCDDL